MTKTITTKKGYDGALVVVFLIWIALGSVIGFTWGGWAWLASLAASALTGVFGELLTQHEKAPPP